MKNKKIEKLVLFDRANKLAVELLIDELCTLL